jgi:hypothetical protein
LPVHEPDHAQGVGRFFIHVLDGERHWLRLAEPDIERRLKLRCEQLAAGSLFPGLDRACEELGERHFQL